VSGRQLKKIEITIAKTRHLTFHAFFFILCLFPAIFCMVLSFIEILKASETKTYQLSVANWVSINLQI